MKLATSNRFEHRLHGREQIEIHDLADTVIAFLCNALFHPGDKRQYPLEILTMCLCPLAQPRIRFQTLPMCRQSGLQTAELGLDFIPQQKLGLDLVRKILEVPVVLFEIRQ